MKTKFNGILTLFLALVVQISFAQQKTISGTVSDESGPLPGVSILIKGTNKGTETNFDGKYSIKAKSGDVLVFRYLGYKTVEKVVGNSGFINAKMEEDANVLEEVVVVGYGTSTKKSFAGTASTIKAENLEAKNFANVTQALAGEVAGVTVINTSGQPGTVGTIRIRGYGSPLGNRAPLYVIDGIPVIANDINGNVAGSGGNVLNSINPADIESTTVLKDATATAIYGSRGANGVVLITTKSGKSSENGIIEVDFKSGVNMQLIPRLDVLTSPEEYIGYVWEGLHNRGLLDNTTPGTDAVDFANKSLFGQGGSGFPAGAGVGYNMWNADAASGALIDPTTKSVRPGVNRLFTPERYADLGFKTGFRTETNLRASGGTAKTRYFASIGYLNDVGYVINTDFKRYSTRLNLTSDVKDWLKVGTNIGYTYSERLNNGQTVGSENVAEQVDKMPPIYPVFARFPNTGTLIPDPVYGGAQYDYGEPTATLNGFNRSRPNANLLNPIASAILDLDNRDTHSINGNMFARFKLSDAFSFETKFGGTYSFLKRTEIGNHVYGTVSGVNGTLSITDQVRWSKTMQQMLRFNKSFGNHSVDALVAYETFERSFSESFASKQNVIVPGLTNFSNYLEVATEPVGFEDASGIESWFTQVNYNYAGKYFFTGSIRTDGSSRFINDKWGIFGSVGGAWVISEESFMEDSFISYLKLKTSWGVTGDQQGVTSSRAFDTFNPAIIGGGLAISERLNGNPDLTWESSTQIQGGLEMSLGKYLDANFDYYRKNTDGLFFNRRVGPSAGISSVLVNDGEVLNAGFEFEVTSHIIEKEDFSLNFSINGEILQNELLEMPIEVSTGTNKIIDSNSSTDGAFAFAKGKSIFDFWMREWAGVDPNDGMPTWNQYYDDANDNGVLDANEADFSTDGTGGALASENTSVTLFEYRKLVPGANIKKTTTKTYSDATQVFVNKSFIPDVRGAFRINGRIKNFDFSTQFTYSLGGYAYDSQYAETMASNNNNNLHKDIAQRWQKPGDITDVPILAETFVLNIASQSTRFITSTDFIALNNARVGYTVPSNFLSKTGLDAVNLWVSGDNLFIQTARQGFNPSLREAGGSARRIYAPATTITMGVRVKF
ncbi:SusC/RagA family TonB-linked outer membrane protein [Polaribacter batillariae]|uniref:SusC/RagA family TonB-linked outer membrane protein n=1 Tax=Polaribacter batillariae TaxID=2808900 RepID=A0ABX7SVE5_9FLAO|nr:SusC/RagA family TonB-linked outer membrane protein [Polaribacter batillariae]QTD36961.1 SusC/RagA family TonB-linked outer membrane protein [Polaribacter batillariae]